MNPIEFLRRAACAAVVSIISEKDKNKRLQGRGYPIEALELRQYLSSGVLREYWSNVSGTAVSSLTADPRYPASPTSSSVLPSFEAPSNVADNYGQRLRAYVTPTASGTYHFAVAADDTAELLMSPNDDPSLAQEVASVPYWTASEQWNLYSSQESSPVQLLAGHRYYIEALQKQGYGGDNLAVGWSGPGINGTAVIGGAYLTAYVPPTAPSTPPAAAKWTFDETSGTTSADTTGNGQTLSLSGGASFTPGRTGDALTLDGSSGYAKTSVPVIDASQSYTVSAWINLNNTGGYQTVFSQDGSNVSAFYLQIRNGTPVFNPYASDSTGATQAAVWGGSSLSTGVWYHVAGVYDAVAGQAKLYVNGQLQGSTAFTSNWHAVGSTVVGAALYDGYRTNYVDGQIDDACVYKSALTEGQIQAEANGYAPTQPVASDAPESLSAQPVTSDPTKILLSWVDDSSEANFVIQRSINGTSWANAGTANADVRSFTDTGLVPGATYAYRIFAASAAGSSGPSPTASAATLTTVPPMLAGQWNFDEAGGTTSADDTGNGHPLTLIGGASFAAGHDGNALTLDGNSGYATAAGSVINTSASFTAAAWVKWNGSGRYAQTVLSQDGSNVSAFYLQLRNGVPTFLVFGADSTGATQPTVWASSALASGAWHYLAGVYDAGTGQIKLYVDGQLQGQQGVNSTFSATGPTVVGAGWYNGRTDYFNGQIDDARLYASSIAYGVVQALAGTVPVAPATPVNVVAESLSGTEAIVRWVDGAASGGGYGAADSYSIQRSDDGGQTYNTVGSVVQNCTLFLDSGLVPGHNYSYRVWANNAAGQSSTHGDALAAITTAPVDTTGYYKISSVGPVVMGSTSNHLTGSLSITNDGWIRAGSPEGAMLKGVGGTLVNEQGIGYSAGLSGALLPTAAGFVVEDWYGQPGDDYDYNDFSIAVTVTGPPILLTNLQATAVSPTEVDLSWTNESANYQQYTIERSTDPTFSPDTTVSFATSSSTNRSAYVDTTAQAGTSYYYRVSGLANFVSSAYSEAVSTLTPPVVNIFQNDGPGFVGSPVNFFFVNTGQQSVNSYDYEFDGSQSFVYPHYTSSLYASDTYTFTQPGTYTVYGREATVNFPPAGPPGGAHTNVVFESAYGPVYQTTVIILPAPVAAPTPIIHFTNSGPGIPGKPIRFQVTSPIAGNEYSYDFYDNADFGYPGNIYDSALPVATHTFDRPGTYTVGVYIHNPREEYPEFLLPGTSIYTYTTQVTIYGLSAPSPGGSGNGGTGNGGSLPTPVNPGSLTVTPSYRFIELQWNSFTPSDGNAATSYNVYETDDGPAGSSPQAGYTPTVTLIGTVPASQTFFFANNLQSDTTYSFRVDAIDGASTASALGQGTTLLAVPSPVQSELLIGSFYGEAYQDENWYNTDSTVTNYLVEQSDDGQPYAQVDNQANIYPVGHLYYYQLDFTNNGFYHSVEVIAVNASGRSDIAAPATPSDLVVSCPSAGTAMLSWDNPSSTTATGILIDVSQNGGAFDTIAEIAGTSSTYTARGLAPGTYTFRVRAFNALTDKTSNTADGTVFASDASSPAPVDPVVASEVSTDQVTLNWTNDGPGIRYIIEEQVAAPMSGTLVYEQIAIAGASPYTVTGLQDDKSYAFAVRAIDANFDGSSLSQSTTTTTLLVPPAPPNTFLAIVPDARGGSDVSLIWDDVYNATSYNIQVSHNGSPWGPVDGDPFGSTVVRDNVYIPQDIYATSVNAWEIQSVNSAGASSWAPFGGSGVIAHGPPTQSPVGGSVPADPTDVTATRVSDSEYDVTWEDNSTNEFGFYIRRLVVNDDGSLTPDGTQFTVGANVTFFADTSVDSTTTYAYEVSAFNQAGESGEAISGESDKPGDPGTGSGGDGGGSGPVTSSISAPSDLTATSTQAGQVILDWDYDLSPSSLRDGFVVMRADGISPGSDDFAQIGTVDPNTTQFIDTTAAAGSDYTYYVYATYQGQQSAMSNPATITASAGLAAPTGLTATTDSSTSVDLTWDSYAGSGNTGGFIITATDVDADTDQTFPVTDPSATSYEADGLTPDTEYTFVIVAVDSSNDQSDDSNSADAKTDPADIGTLTVTDANAESSSVEATVDDPNPTDPLDIVSDADGNASITLSATDDGDNVADAGILWQVVDSNGEIVESGNGDFGSGDPTIPLSDTDGSGEFKVEAGPDTDQTGLLTDAEIDRTVLVDVSIPQISSFTVSSPNIPSLTVTATSPDQPVDLYIPEDAIGHAQISLSAAVNPTSADLSMLDWKFQSGSGHDPDNGDFGSDIAQPVTLAPDGSQDFVLVAWYDADGDGQIDNGEQSFEVDVHVVKLQSLTVTDDNGDSHDGDSQTATADPGNPANIPVLNATADSNGDALVDLNAGFIDEEYPDAASLISYRIAGDTSTTLSGTFAGQTGDDSDQGVPVNLPAGTGGGDYFITAWADVDGDQIPSPGEIIRVVEVKVAPAVATAQLTSLTATDDSNPANTVTADFSDAADGSDVANLYVAEKQPSGTAVVDLSSVYTPTHQGQHILWSVDGNTATPASGTFGSSSIQITLTPGDTDYTVLAWPDSDGTTPTAGGADTLEIDVHVVSVALHIDSNNDGQITSADDAIKNDPTLPGKIIPVDDGDLNGNGVPDYADGFDAFGSGATGEHFTPLQVAVSPNIDFANASFSFDYDESNPTDISQTGAGTAYNPYVYVLPAAGSLRLWLDDGTHQRIGLPIEGGGDLIASDDPITAAQLGLSRSTPTVTLYVEGVKLAAMGADQITITMSSDGITTRDMVRATVAKAYLGLNAASDNMTGAVDFTTVGSPVTGLRPSSPDVSFRIDGADEYYEKLWPGLKWWFAQPGSIPDSATALTDMEDFIPVDINIPQSMQPLLDAGFVPSLQMSYQGDSGVSVEVYPNLSPANNPMAFLSSYNAGQSGVSEPEAALIARDNSSYLEVQTLSANSPEVELSNLDWGTGVSTVHYSVGDNELLLRILDPNTTSLAAATIKLSLMLESPSNLNQEYAIDTAIINASDISHFYTTVTALGETDADREVYNQPDSTFNYPTESGGMVTGSSYSYQIASNNRDPAINQTLIFIHGFNVTPDDATTTFDEVYKRVYWQGFRGNFVGFNWAGFDGDLTPLLHYDLNNQQALETGSTLYQFLINTVESSSTNGWGVPAGDVNLMAHSMGNVVMYDALRINSSLHSGPIAHNAISIEAAVWADAFSTIPTPNLSYQYTDNEGVLNTISLTPAQLEQATWYGFFSNVKSSLSGAILNSYLSDDFALQAFKTNDELYRGAEELAPITPAPYRTELNIFNLPDLIGKNANLVTSTLSDSLDPPVGETSNPLATVNFNAALTNWRDAQHSDYYALNYPAIWTWWSEFLTNNSAFVINKEL